MHWSEYVVKALRRLYLFFFFKSSFSYITMIHRLLSLNREIHKHVNNDSQIAIHNKKYMKPQDVAVYYVHLYIAVALSFFGIHSLQKFLNNFIIHCVEIKRVLELFMFPGVCNTWVIRVFINNIGKAISWVHNGFSSLIYHTWMLMACHLAGAEPISKPMLEYCKLYPWEQLQDFLIEIWKMHLGKCIWKCRLYLTSRLVFCV